MFVQAKDLAAVAAHPLEDAVTEQEPVIEDADAGLFLVDELAVDVDLQRHGAGVSWLVACESRGLDLALDQLHGAIGLFGNRQIVCHHDYSEIFLAVQGSQDAQDFRPVLAVQVPGRFVGQQQLGRGDQGAGNGRPLHFAPGQLARPVPQPVRQADQVQQFLGPLDVGPLAAPVPPDALARS